MISSIDQTNAGATLLAQTEASTLTKTSATSTSTTAPISLPPAPTSTTSGSLTDTLNGLVTMLQNLMASISALLGGLGNGDTKTAPAPVDSGRYDFLRQVDQEPVTVIKPPKAGSGASNLGQVPLDNQPPTAVDTPKEPTKPNARDRDIGTALRRSNSQFLWKPQSEKDGKLAILLPKGLTGQVKGVQILSPDLKTVLGKGKFSGVGNEDREHYRFSKAGGGYPDGAVVVITMADGSKHHVKIKETSNRTTR